MQFLNSGLSSSGVYQSVLELLVPETFTGLLQGKKKNAGTVVGESKTQGYKEDCVCIYHCGSHRGFRHVQLCRTICDILKCNCYITYIL